VTEAERFRFLIACERPDEVTPAQRPGAIPFDHIAEVERLCAVDLIQTARRVRERAQGWDEMTREKFARRFIALALELDTAAAYLRRHRADTSVPEWLREQGAM
jgi:hypothetical protein